MARQPEHLVDQQRRLGRYLAALREAAGLCQPDIARAVPCHRTTVTHAEAGSQLPASDFWETADRLVDANGALIARYDELIQAKAAHLAEQQAKRRARAQATVEELATTPPPMSPKSSQTVIQWNSHSIILAIRQMTGEDLSITRREALAAGAPAGAALTEPLQQWLFPIHDDVEVAPRRSDFSSTELASLEGLVEQFKNWNGNGALARKAVIAQLKDVTDRLRGVSSEPSTWRAFGVAAKLSEVVASMSWDAGLHRFAQRYYVASVQLAKLANDDGLAAIVLAALARQCYDLGRPRDGLEVVRLAQYGSRKTATALLRAMLTTREAWGYAQVGDTQAFNRAVGLAEEHFSDGPSDGDHPAIQDFDAAELVGTIGGRYRDLARHEPRWARKAQDYTQQALSLRHPSQLRLRVFDLIGLARTQLITADPQRACELVHQAIPCVQPWANGRVGAKLREFHQEASQYAEIPVVRDTRDLIRELTSSNGWMMR
ncbi:MAG: helix-turn-helix transcriptional regulator [Pseudonocardiaceae bacterium]